MEQNIEYNDEKLNRLFDEMLEGLKEDLAEVSQNVELYKSEVINNSTGKDAYGSLYNDALRIKGATRDRMLKAITIIKDRIKIKEIVVKTSETGGPEMSPEKIIAAMDKLEKNQKDAEENESNGV